MFGMKLAKLGKNFQRKVYPKGEIYFPPTKYPYGFSDHLLYLFFYIYFTISFPNGSQDLVTSAVINRYCTPSLTKISVAIF